MLGYLEDACREGLEVMSGLRALLFLFSPLIDPAWPWKLLFTFTVLKALLHLLLILLLSLLLYLRSLAELLLLSCTLRDLTRSDVITLVCRADLLWVDTDKIPSLLFLIVSCSMAKLILVLIRDILLGFSFLWRFFWPWSNTWESYFLFRCLHGAAGLLDWFPSIVDTIFFCCARLANSLVLKLLDCINFLILWLLLLPLVSPIEPIPGLESTGENTGRVQPLMVYRYQECLKNLQTVINSQICLSWGKPSRDE